jgi:hypothetical protein
MAAQNRYSHKGSGKSNRRVFRTKIQLREVRLNGATMMRGGGAERVSTLVSKNVVVCGKKWV